jgi:hypothetical protein
VKTRLISISDTIIHEGQWSEWHLVPLPRSQNVYQLTFFSFIADAAVLNNIGLFVKRGDLVYPLVVFTDYSGKRSGQMVFEAYVLPDHELYIWIDSTDAVQVQYTIQGEILSQA